MTRGLSLGAVTIHQVVEQEAPFFDFRKFFQDSSPMKPSTAIATGWRRPTWTRPRAGSCCASRATSCRPRITTS